MLGDLKFAGAVPAANGMIIFAPNVADIADFNYPIELAANFRDAGSLQYLSPAWWLLFPRTVGESAGTAS